MRRELHTDQGIPAPTLLMMSAVAGLTVANLYYNQPLLEEIRSSLDCSETMSNMITVVTQAGYALGLLLIVPMADMWSRRRIVTVIMGIAATMAACIALSSGIWTVLAASLLLGACSVIPQIFIPIAGQFSRPEHKSRNMGYVLSGLLTGILGARVISGYVGQIAGWRTMFGSCGSPDDCLPADHIENAATYAEHFQRIVQSSDSKCMEDLHRSSANEALCIEGRMHVREHDEHLGLHGLSPCR